MSVNKLTPPSLSDLMIKLVNTLPADESAAGEVEPHEVAVGFRIDPQLAWREGLVALATFGAGIETAAMPAEWSGLLSRHESASCQPFALTSYPQQVRDIASLLQTTDLATLMPDGESVPASPKWVAWGEKQLAKNNPVISLVIAALYRTIRDFDRADRILADVADGLPKNLQPLYANEQAALLWQRGRAAEALAAWESMPESGPVLFNRGMAALFLKQAGKAATSLRAAVALLPESDGWHHLASLYLALAEMRV